MIIDKLSKLIIAILILFIGLIPIVLLPIMLFAFKYWIWALFVILLYYVFNFIALIFAYQNNRTDIQAKITWTVIEFAMPGFGAYIFFIGARRPSRILRHLKRSELLENELLADKKINNSQIELLLNGEEKYPLVFQELKKAKHYINIQYFIMNSGIFHSNLINILREKNKEGVKIRIIYDYLGSVGNKWPEKEIRSLRKEGIEILEFRKIYWWKISGADNWRTHNKSITIDNKIVFFGGLNFGDEYGGLSPKYGDWLDVHYKANQDLVKIFDGIFYVQWFIGSKQELIDEYKNNSKLPNNGEEGIIINNKFELESVDWLYDSPDRDIPLTFEKLKNEVLNAKESIKIITPYVAFPISFKSIIRQAVNKGIKMEIITVGRADKKSAFYQGSFDIDTLTDIGVKVYRVNNVFLHSKMFIFDDKKSIFGTSNLDYRALFHHFETNLFVESKNELTDFVEYFDWLRDMSNLNISRRSQWTIRRSMAYFVVRFFKGAF